MNRIIDQKLEENEIARNPVIDKAVSDWDHQANEDYLRLLELALEDRGQQVRLVGLARAHAPAAIVRVGAAKQG